jgi:hypothetical protein
MEQFNLFLKLAQNLTSDGAKTNELQDIKAAIENKIPKVTCSRKIFESLPAGSKVPIAILEVSYVKSWFSSEPALLVRFGTFEEQRMTETAEQISFVSSLISSSGFFIENYNVASISAGNAKNNIKNSNYGVYIAVTLVE